MLKQATVEEAQQVALLAQKLWHNNEVSDLQAEMAQLLHKKDAFIVLAYAAEQAIGFAQCQLRYDYVQGTETSPVGYLEGVYVEKGARLQGLAKKLIAACEEWARQQGCTEFASDCELDNQDSLNMHLQLGFSEANRVICFTKKL
ncbi:GNAT family N-acetyltransferase [Metasolibacillus meyeri]|uniref:Aminoglycoside N(6')-acetyltransferase type 1 n=2 Tax=Metasolibacillus meyeri TaxID=1071052 RepID=A0AAW9NQ29_9BACL|nr:GNAT family N-acetyltransferase [Metasolibacillus meyeri]